MSLTSDFDFYQNSTQSWFELEAKKALDKMDSDFTDPMHMMIMFQRKFDKSQNLGTWCDLEDVV